MGDEVPKPGASTDSTLTHQDTATSLETEKMPDDMGEPLANSELSILGASLECAGEHWDSNYVFQTEAEDIDEVPKPGASTDSTLTHQVTDTSLETEKMQDAMGEPLAT